MILLDDYSWLGTSTGQDAWRSLISHVSKPSDGPPPASSGPPVSPGAIRTAFGCSPSQAKLLSELLHFARGKAKEKVIHPDRWFWTRQLLEQSSDEWTAHETALDAPQQIPHWIDACCGAGADAIALARRRAGVMAIDNQSVAIQLAQANAIMNDVQLDLRTCDIETLDFERDSFLNIDPDRRPDGDRTIDPLQSRPSWSWISEAIQRVASVSLKLAPGFRLQPDFSWGNAASPQAMRWLSWGGSVRQQRWYWGIHRWPKHVRIVSAGNHKSGWHHEVFPNAKELGTNFASAYTEGRFIEDSASLTSGFIADHDPVIRAAGVGEALADRLELQCIGDRHGYLANTHPVPHPMLRWFEILHIVSMDLKKVRAVARSLRVSTWELKSRGVEVDLQAWRRSLPVVHDSDQTLTILFTRVGKRHLAIFARRTETE